MGYRLLHQSPPARGIGAIPARGANSHDSREKVKAGGRKARPPTPKNFARVVILQDSARYPSGPRERSAKPPFVGSNPTRASKLLVSNQWITTFGSFQNPPLGKIREQYACRIANRRKGNLGVPRFPLLRLAIR